METALTVIHVVICLFLILVVLLQAGQGGDMGSAFGGGTSSGTVFGGSGAGGFLRKLTIGAAASFMILSMTLAYLASRSSADSLKRYSAQQHLAEERKHAAHLEAVGNEDETPDAPQSKDQSSDDQSSDDSATPDDGSDSAAPIDQPATDDNATGDSAGDTSGAAKPEAKPAEPKPVKPAPAKPKAAPAKPKPAPAKPKPNKATPAPTAP